MLASVEKHLFADEDVGAPIGGDPGDSNGVREGLGVVVVDAIDVGQRRGAMSKIMARKATLDMRPPYRDVVARQSALSAAACGPAKFAAPNKEAPMPLPLLLPIRPITGAV